MQVQAGRSGLQAVTRKLEKGQRLEGLDDLLESGAIASYSEQGDTVTLYTTDPSQVQDLSVREGHSKKSLLQKAKAFVTPTHMERDCAPEYKKYKLWSLAAAALNGVIGFMATQVYFDAEKASFSDSEKKALAGVITGTLGKITQMASSPLAKLGDADPKKSYLRSSLITSANATLGLGLLSVVPTGHFPLFAVTSVTGTLAGTIGAAAGANIFHHLAHGPTKGDVVAKGRNQQLVATLWGMPFGLALSRVATALGLPPGLFAACTLGPLMGFCNLQAARALRMNPAGTAELQQIADHMLDHGGALPEAPAESLWGTVKGLFTSSESRAESSVRFVDDLTEAVSEKAGFLFRTFAGQKHLVNLNSDGTIKVALQKEATREDAFKAFVQARFLERAVQQGVLHRLSAEGCPEPAENLIRLARGLEVGKMGEELSKRGWHLSMAQLRLPTVDAAWSGEAGPAPEPFSWSQAASLLAGE